MTKYYTISGSVADIDVTPERYWDDRARTYNPGGVGALGAHLLEVYEKHRVGGDRKLEVGSGNGRIYDLFFREHLASNYKMCDISSAMAGRCWVDTGARPDIWDGVTLPYPEDAFEWVISFSVMLHVPPPDIAHFIAEHVRVTSRYLFVSTFDGNAPHLAPHCFQHDYPALFDAAGLSVVEHRYFDREQQGQWLLEKCL